MPVPVTAPHAPGPLLDGNPVRALFVVLHEALTPIARHTQGPALTRNGEHVIGLLLLYAGLLGSLSVGCQEALIEL